jgi:hypothetical protein
MGIFSNFTGGQSRRDIAAATGDANRMLDEGQQAALARLEAARNEQLASLTSGYDTSRGYLDTGMTTGRADIGAGYDRARTDLGTQYGRAEEAITGALDRSRDILNPWIQSGRGAQELYDQALGVNGTGAQSDFYANYADNDPFRAYNEDRANNALLRLYNAGGLGTSGRAGMAISRAQLERGSEDLNNYLNRLEAQGAKGGQYATTMTGLETGAGQNLASIRTNLGNQYAGIETDRGNRLADIAFKGNAALSDLSTGFSLNKANVQGQGGSDAANLIYGTAQQKAGNRIGQGNAVAGTRSTGMNNLIGLGSLALGGYSAYKGIPNQVRV